MGVSGWFPVDFVMRASEERALHASPAARQFFGVPNRRPPVQLRPHAGDMSVRSPTGVIHAATDHERWGLKLTACGQYIDRGWVTSQEQVSCVTCAKRGR